jgi:hypothetical protein
MRACSYVDRRGEACTTEWCMDHMKVVAGIAYCPRHAGIMKAVGRSSAPDERPPLKCRAPSLTAWLADLLNPQISDLVADLGQTGFGPQVVREDLSHRVGSIPAHHHWEQRWQVRLDERRPVDILIDVKEEVDVVVRVRVNDVVVTRIVPPWIERHHRRNDGEDEDRVRVEFCQQIASLIGQALEVNLASPPASNWMMNRADGARAV